MSCFKVVYPALWYKLSLDSLIEWVSKNHVELATQVNKLKNLLKRKKTYRSFILNFII